MRCSVERFDIRTNGLEGWGNDMLDGFMESDFGKEVAGNCVKQQLEPLLAKTRRLVRIGEKIEIRAIRANPDRGRST